MGGDGRLESILTDTSAPLAERAWAAGAVELRMLARLAAPAVVVYMINYVMSMSTQIFSGHLGNLELAAASLGNTGVQTFAYGLMVIPRWCADKRPCWEKIVEKWTDEGWQAEHKVIADKRKLMGCPGHRQGNLTIPGVVCKHKEDTGQVITYFEAWTNKRTKDDKDKDPEHPERDWISSKAKSDGENYTKKLKEKYGEDVDPRTAPFDPIVAIAAAGGRPNGRMAIHLDSVITSSLPRVSTLRAMSTSSAPTIERHVPHTVTVIDEIQSRLSNTEKERDENRAQLKAQNELVKSLQHMVANLYSMQGKPVPEMPATPEWNILNPSQGSNNVPTVPPPTPSGAVGVQNAMMAPPCQPPSLSSVHVSTPSTETV